MRNFRTINFGKHKGKQLIWVIQNEPGYIRWCLEKGIFHEKEIEQEIELTKSGTREPVERATGVKGGNGEITFEYDNPDLSTIWGSTNIPSSESRIVESLSDDCFKSTLYCGWPVGYFEYRQVCDQQSYQKTERAEADKNRRVDERGTKRRRRSA